MTPWLWSWSSWRRKSASSKMKMRCLSVSWAMSEGTCKSKKKTPKISWGRWSLTFSTRDMRTKWSGKNFWWWSLRRRTYSPNATKLNNPKSGRTQIDTMSTSKRGKLPSGILLCPRQRIVCFKPSRITTLLTDQSPGYRSMSLWGDTRKENARHPFLELLRLTSWMCYN